MALFDEIGKKISRTGQEAVKQTKVMANVAKYNGNIGTLEKKIQEIFLELGRQYYQEHQQDLETEFLTQITEINECLDEIQELREKIQQEKGVTICSKCGAEVNSNSLFCSSCGTMVETSQMKPKDEKKTICPHCRNVVNSEVSFCTFCGGKITNDESKENELEQKMSISQKACPQCGQVIEEEAMFCENCGYKISE